jgi:hypothetical protein
MLEPIFLDTRSLSMEFDMTQKDADELKSSVVKVVTKVVHTAWVNNAKRGLNSTRDQYINSIIVGEEGRFTNVVRLVGDFVNGIEQGMSPFDMKEGFENSNKKTITKGKDGSLGWYLTIPFSWAQPTSLGESSTFNAVLPKDVSAAMKSKQKRVGYGNKSALALDDIPDQFKIEPTFRPELTLASGKLIPEYTHSNNIYEGTAQKKKGATVMSFRRVSSNSDEGSWFHTGTSPRNFADRAVDEADIPGVTTDVIDKFLDQLIG